MLETERLVIREIRTKDYPALLDIYRKKSNMQYILSGRNDWTMSELKEKWKKDKYNSKTKTGFWIIEIKENEKIVGECGLLKTERAINEQLEIAYLLDVSYWNKGLGMEICQCLLKYGFETLNLKSISAGMYRQNIRSSKLLRKFGFKMIRVGKSKGGIEYEKYELERGVYCGNRIE